MNYLFFDCEFASSKGGIERICEFGYVIVDEKFNVLEKDNLIINPNIDKKEWDHYALRKILTRKRNEYENSPSFFYFYNKIKNVIENVDYVFGHTLSSDAKALNDECIRYSRESINFSFYDVKEIYKQFDNVKHDLSVTKIKEALNINGEEVEHDALADAYNTMLILKEMLEELDFSIEDLLELVPTAKDECNDYKVSSLEAAKERKRQALANPNITSNDTNYRDNKILFYQFIDNVKPFKNGDKLKDKKISITMSYEKTHFKQILNLIQLIIDEGGKFILKASESDIFIKYDSYDDEGNLCDDLRYNYVIEANQNGSNIEIIEFKEFLKIFEINEEELDAMALPSFEFLLSNDAIIKNKKTKRILNNQNETVIDPYIEDESMSSVGELFGDFFKDLISER